MLNPQLQMPPEPVNAGDLESLAARWRAEADRLRSLEANGQAATLAGC